MIIHNNLNLKKYFLKVVSNGTEFIKDYFKVQKQCKNVKMFINMYIHQKKMKETYKKESTIKAGNKEE